MLPFCDLPSFTLFSNTAGMEFTIVNWAVYGPEIHSKADALAWARGEKEWGEEGGPDVSFLPASFRRRMTGLSKIGLAAAHACLDGKDPGVFHTVFGSRYGENMLTTRLLNEIADGEEMSPMKFSMSVHNTTSGLFSIASKSHAPTTAVAGGRDSFFYSLLEAVGQLEANPAIPVLLVFNEEPIHEVYDPFREVLRMTYGLALHLEKKGEGQKIQGQLQGPENGASDLRNALPQSLVYLKWLLSNQTSLIHQQGYRAWHWSKV